MILPDLKEIESLPADQIPAVLARLAAMQSMLAARLMVTPSIGNGLPSPGDHLMEIGEAAERLGVSLDWIYRRSEKLPFVVRLGSRLRFSSNGIEKYIAQRRGRTA